MPAESTVLDPKLEPDAPRVQDAFKTALERELGDDRAGAHAGFSDGPQQAFSDGGPTAFSDGPPASVAPARR